MKSFKKKISKERIEVQIRWGFIFNTEGKGKTGDVECFFCKKKRHVKKDCFKFKEWTKKKGGIEQTLVCFESNPFDVPSNIWWID